MLLLILGGQGAAVTGLDLAAAMADLLPSLQAGRFEDLTFWTEDELYTYADEAAKRLARAAGVWVERDATTALVAGTATYSLPTRHISTIHCSVGGAALKPSNIQELEALDSDWPTTTASVADAADNPERFIQDGQGTEVLTVYPKPGADASGNLGLIFHQYLVDITDAAAAISAPKVLREYFTFRVLAEARAKESKAAMPEVAQWAAGMADLLEQVAQDYWGGAL